MIQCERSWFGELLNSVLSFLQLLLERALSHSTIKAYASAISACHEGFGERLVFNILSWRFSNKAWGGNVWWCTSLLLSGNSPWFCQRPFQQSISSPMGRSLSGCCQLRQQFVCTFGPLELHTYQKGPKRCPSHDWTFMPVQGSFSPHPTGEKKKRSIICLLCDMRWHVIEKLMAAVPTAACSLLCGEDKPP